MAFDGCNQEELKLLCFHFVNDAVTHALGYIDLLQELSAMPALLYETIRLGECSIFTHLMESPRPTVGLSGDSHLLFLLAEEFPSN
jgi:hypothetical protein